MVAQPRGASKGQPVIGLLWDDAKAYVLWLSRKTNRSYRLLTEAERECVTRAGTTRPFWRGTAIPPGDANCDRTVGWPD